MTFKGYIGTRKIDQIDPVWGAIISSVVFNAEHVRRIESLPLLLQWQAVCELFVLAELVRWRWDKKFSIGKPPRDSATRIRLEAALWNECLSLIEKVFEYNPAGFVHPSLWFFEVRQEKHLFGPFNAEGGKVCLTRWLQSSNKALRGMTENPFDLEHLPATATLIDEAMKLANQSDEFRSRYYMPTIKAREAYSAWVRIHGDTVVVTQGKYGIKQLRQGRKKKSEQKTKLSHV